MAYIFHHIYILMQMTYGKHTFPTIFWMKWIVKTFWAFPIFGDVPIGGFWICGYSLKFWARISRNRDFTIFFYLQHYSNGILVSLRSVYIVTYVFFFYFFQIVSTTNGMAIVPFDWWLSIPMYLIWSHFFVPFF